MSVLCKTKLQTPFSEKKVWATNGLISAVSSYLCLSVCLFLSHATNTGTVASLLYPQNLTHIQHIAGAWFLLNMCLNKSSLQALPLLLGRCRTSVIPPYSCMCCWLAITWESIAALNNQPPITKDPLLQSSACWCRLSAKSPAELCLATSPFAVYFG